MGAEEDRKDASGRSETGLASRFRRVVGRGHGHRLRRFRRLRQTPTTSHRQVVMVTCSKQRQFRLSFFPFFLGSSNCFNGTVGRVLMI